MSDNFLDEDGGRAFANFLESNTTLETLKVNNCKGVSNRIKLH